MGNMRLHGGQTIQHCDAKCLKGLCVGTQVAQVKVNTTSLLKQSKAHDNSISEVHKYSLMN